MCSNSSCIKYADDITILHFIRNSDDDFCQVEWEHAIEWAERNDLPLNTSKCSVMNIVTKSNLSVPPITLSDEQLLRSVSSVPMLGVIFSNNMKWNAHVDSIVSRASRRFYILYNLAKSGCPPSLLHRVYVLCIRSILVYACPVFCNIPVYLQKKLTGIERRASRILQAKPDVSISDVASTMCQRLFDSIQRDARHPLREMFKTRGPTPRNQRTLCAPIARTKRYGDSFIKFSHR